MQLLFIHPDPRHFFGGASAADEGFQCLSDGPVRNIREPDVARKVLLVQHGVVGIGPYMRAYEGQDFRKAWQDPPPGVMTLYRRFLSDCTHTGFVDAVAPADPIRITFVNRWMGGRVGRALCAGGRWIKACTGCVRVLAASPQPCRPCTGRCSTLAAACAR